MFSMRKKCRRTDWVAIAKKVAFCIMIFLVLLLLEYFIIELFLGDSVLKIGLINSVKNLILIGAVNGLLWGIFRGLRWMARVSLSIVLVLGLVNYFLKSVRGFGVVMMDFFAVGTAANVAGQYHLKIQLQLIVAIVVWLFTFLASFLIPKKRTSLGKEKSWLVYGGIFIASVLLFVWMSFSPSFMEGVNAVVWDQNLGMSEQGYVLYFYANAGEFTVDKPKGYSVKKVASILQPYSNNETKEKDGTMQNPNLIMIMNESYSDLSVFGKLHTNIPVMPFYKSLKKNTIKGYAYSSVYGGYTANSEYEFLTGGSKLFLPGNPYLQYIRREYPTLITTIKSQKGYEVAEAIHPYNPSGYDRDRVYPLLGFDNFYSLQDFKKTKKVRKYIGDMEDYKKIEELYEKKKKGTSLCVFNVTMQNHSPYDYRKYQFKKPVYGKEFHFEKDANQYLSLIRMSDDALKQLITYFKKQSEPTIVVLFGDHQPFLDDQFFNTVYQKNPNQFKAKDIMREHMVPFMIWANYDIPEKENMKISLNYLSNIFMEQAGLTMTPYQKYLESLRKEIPVISAVGYYDKMGKLHNAKDRKGKYGKLLKEYEMVQYNYLFDKKNRLDQYFQVGTN